MAEKQIWQKIGEGFIQEYYNQFDNTNRMEIANLYVSISILAPGHWGPYFKFSLFIFYSVVSCCMFDLGRISSSRQRSNRCKTSCKYPLIDVSQIK